MTNKFTLLIVLGMFLLSSNTPKPLAETGKVTFYVDPSTNSDDPEIRMAYGLNIVPPWSDGGSIFVNLPEHFEYMPGTKGIARHHDKRENVWQISVDSTEAHYAVESITEPGVFFSVKATSAGQRAQFEMTITNHSEKQLNSLRPMFCYQYNLLKGFPIKLTENFAHTFIIVNNKLVSVAGLPVKNSNAIARMAHGKDCKDEHNWWAEEMGGFIEQRMDAAYTVLTSANDDRKVLLRWTPGKNLLTNAYIPCIHADPCMGDLAPGESRTVNGELIFTRIPLKQITEEFPASHNNKE
jgi:hypothetical protein